MDCRATISNCSNNYGPYHFPEKLIPLVIVNILQGEPLPIYGDGLNVRDWLHVSDHCRVSTPFCAPASGEVYNIGGDPNAPIWSWSHRCVGLPMSMLAPRPELLYALPACPRRAGSRRQSSSDHFVTDRPGHDRRYATDCGKIERALDFRPRVELSNGLRATFDWYLANEPWWRAILDGKHQGDSQAATRSAAVL